MTDRDRGGFRETLAEMIDRATAGILSPGLTFERGRPLDNPVTRDVPVQFVPHSNSAPDHLGPRFRDQMEGAVFGRSDRTQVGVDQARDEALQAALAQIEAEFAASVAGAGGANASHRQAITEAANLLSDVRGNREAIAGTYDDFLEFLDPHEQARAEAAGQIVETATPAFEEMATERSEGIEADFGEAEAIVDDVADLIGAGKRSQEAAKELITGKGLALEDAAAEAAEIMALIEMEEAVATTGAAAQEASTEGETRRRAEVTDAQFGSMEEEAANRLARARAAAASAAAAAGRRRAAARAQRDAAVAAAREQLGGLDPIEAGQFGALQYLNQNGTGIPADRQQFIQGRTMEAIENFVPANPLAVQRVFEDQDISSEEARLIAGAIDAFGDTRDREQSLIEGRPDLPYYNPSS